MGRSKEFEPKQVLDKAMRLFWQKGYTATSIGDLVQATGVQRYGLYGTFGDKHNLFLQTLDHYQASMVGQMVRVLESETASWSAITAFFEQLLNIAHTPSGQLGCLMCNSATELAAHDLMVAEKMTIYEDRLSGLFEKALLHAEENSEIGPNLDLKQSAIFLLGITVGFFALVKSPLPSTDLDDYVSVALNGLIALSKA